MTFKKLYKATKAALSNEDHDYTKGSISLAVFMLAVPMILELSLESVFALVDIFFVGKLGAVAIATVGLTESVLMIIYSLAIGLSTAATAIVARRIGEKNHEDAAKSGLQSLYLALVISLVFSVWGFVFAPEILTLMGAQKEVVKEGATFLRIMLGNSHAIIFLFLINGIFRGAGNASMAMKSLWIASIMNIILCPILIHLYGLNGAAIATVIGRSTGVAFQCYHLFVKKGLLKFKRSHFKIHFTAISNILHIAWPASLQFIISSGSWIILASMIAKIGGTDASAGYQIAIRNFVFFVLPAWGLSNAAATLVGQNLGAGKIKRAERSVLLCIRYNTIFMFIVTLFFLIFAQPIIFFFNKDPKVVAYGIEALKILGGGYIIYGISMVLSQALNGAGDTKTPTYINFVAFWLFQIPFAWFLSYYLEMGPYGVFWALPAAEIIVSGLAWYYFRKGNWKKIEV